MGLCRRDQPPRSVLCRRDQPLARCRLSFLPAQDALERAVGLDEQGQRPEAAKVYRTTLNIIYEGLALDVPSPGLGPEHSNVARWRSEMNAWQQQVLDR